MNKRKLDYYLQVEHGSCKWAEQLFSIINQIKTKQNV